MCVLRLEVAFLPSFLLKRLENDDLFRAFESQFREKCQFHWNDEPIPYERIFPNPVCKVHWSQLQLWHITEIKEKDEQKKKKQQKVKKKTFNFDFLLKRFVHGRVKRGERQPVVHNCGWVAHEMCFSHIIKSINGCLFCVASSFSPTEKDQISCFFYDQINARDSRHSEARKQPTLTTHAPARKREKKTEIDKNGWYILNKLLLLLWQSR